MMHVCGLTVDINLNICMAGFQAHNNWLVVHMCEQEFREIKYQHLSKKKIKNHCVNNCQSLMCVEDLQVDTRYIDNLQFDLLTCADNCSKHKS